MGKIIDADEFLYNLTHWFDQHGIEHEMTSGLFNIVVIEGAIKITKESKPTVDAAKHGEWIPFQRPNGGYYIGCSICSFPMPTDSMFDFMDETDNRFCYNCGAKMDGKEQENEQ